VPSYTRRTGKYLFEKKNKKIINSLLRYWPRNDIKKEKLFLEEMSTLIELIEPEVFDKVAKDVFKRLTICLSSSCEEVI
jgi:hypothetical protein